MLKIKDNIDLKELEKFGFNYIPEQKKNIWEHYSYTEEDENNVYPMLRCYVYCKDRIIGVHTNELDILFDLIQAGLVEKVVDNGE